MAVRNEDWVIGASARIALMWVDQLVVLNHASTDRTAEILDAVSREHPGRVHIITETDPTWREMAHRQRMLVKARELKATHIAITDADEVLTGNLLQTVAAGKEPLVRAQIASLPAGGSMSVGMPCMWRSLDQYRIDGRIWANRTDLTLAFRDTPRLSWSAAGGYDHHQREPKESRTVFRAYGWSGGVMHLQWCSWRRLVAKHARYKAMERIKYPAKPVAEIEHTYNQALDEAGLQVANCPAEWWAPYSHLRKHINLDAAPWHEAEVKRLWSEHGPAAFQGLNLFGVAA